MADGIKRYATESFVSEKLLTDVSWDNLQDRPFYEETVWVKSSTNAENVNFTGSNSTIDFTFSGGKYAVIWDDVEYTSDVYWIESGRIMCLGNITLYSSDYQGGNNEPFLFLYDFATNDKKVCTDTDGEHAYSVYSLMSEDSVTQLDEKFIPDTIARTEDIVANALSYDEQTLTEDQQMQARENLGVYNSIITFIEQGTIEVTDSEATCNLQLYESTDIQLTLTKDSTKYILTGDSVYNSNYDILGFEAQTENCNVYLNYSNGEWIFTGNNVVSDGTWDFILEKVQIIQVPDEFIPDTIARTSDIPEVPKQVQADWNQNDETAADYIKNRLCYTTDPVETVLFDGDVEFSIKNDTYGIVTEGLEDIIPNITEGQTYTVIFDGVTYETECWKFDYYVSEILALGAETTAFNSYDKTDFSNYPFSIQVEKLNNVAMVMTNDIDNTSHYIKITANLSETVQLDEKYIAYKPGLKVEGNVYVIDEEEQNAEIGAEIFNDYENNIAVGLYSHASGYQTVASGAYSYTEGAMTTASGSCAHAEGFNTTASGYLGSHAEGFETVASAYYAHAEGEKTVASANGSHVEGVATIAASNCQHVQGKCNIEDADSKYAHIVGNGKDENNRSNAHTLDWDGNGWYQGSLYVGGTSQDDAEQVATLSDIVNSKYNQISMVDDENGYDYIVRMRGGKLISYCAASSIAVTTLPTKTEYIVGETFDATGMVATATCQDGTEREVTCTYSEEALTVDNTTLEISYTENGQTFTTTIAITVTEAISTEENTETIE